MRVKRLFSVVVGCLLMGMLLAGCGGDSPAAEEPASSESSSSGASEEATEMAAVTLQLKWVAQAQFAGYYAALDQGFYKDEG